MLAALDERRLAHIRGQIDKSYQRSFESKQGLARKEAVKEEYAPHKKL